MTSGTAHRHASQLFPADERPVVRVRCPHCNQNGTLEGQGAVKDVYNGQGPLDATYYTVRVCPDPDCRGVSFAMVDRQGEVRELFPEGKVQWDAANLPEEVRDSFQEATDAFSARCYRATALMARRTLELVCESRQATGANLYERVEALGSKAVVPAGLFAALHNLRLLGNDAAHVNATDYLTVGREEASLAIDVTRELLKAVYQYEDLVARLEALRK